MRARGVRRYLQRFPAAPVCFLVSYWTLGRGFAFSQALGRKPHITHSVDFNVGLVAFLDWFVAQLLSQTRGLPITLAKCLVL